MQFCSQCAYSIFSTKLCIAIFDGRSFYTFTSIINEVIKGKVDEKLERMLFTITASSLRDIQEELSGHLSAI